METNYRQLARITDPENLLDAWKRVRTKKAAGGLDGKSVEDFERDVEKELQALREEIIAGRYVPEPLLQIQIPKSNKPGEKRSLGLPSVRDKVAQEAVRTVIEPAVDKDFMDASYGYRRGKGPAKAIGRVRHILGNGAVSWLVDIDIDDFFPSIDHDLLLERLRIHGVDEPVCRLCLLWLKMGVVDGRGKWRDVYEGVSQGGIVSPLLANIYLHPLDLYLVEKGVPFVRYADDIRMFFPARSQAVETHAAIRDFLDTSLRLRLNPHPEPVAPIDKGFTFLGVFFTPQELHIDPSKWDTFREKLKALFARGTDLSGVVRKVNESVAGWKRYYGALVAPHQMARLETLLMEVTGGYVATLLREPAEADKARPVLEQLDLPISRSGADRTRFFQDVMQRAKELAARAGEKGDPNREVRKAVLEKKRRHLRKIVQVSHLVVDTPGLFVGKQDQRVVIREGRETRYEVPFNKLESITLSCRSVSLSADVITACAQRSIPLMFIAPKGDVEAILNSPIPAAGHLQVRQIEASVDPVRSFATAKMIVQGKIRNQIILVKYFSKYEKRKKGGPLAEFEGFMEAADKIEDELAKLTPADTVEQNRGRLFSVEGRLATSYWKMMARLLNGTGGFSCRVRQGANDLVNCLLNYGYAILLSRVLLEIHRHGLNPCIGFLHVARKGNPVLAFDLMELFRPQAVDRVVFSELRRFASRHELEPSGLLSRQSRHALIRKIGARMAMVEIWRTRELTLQEIMRQQVKEFCNYLSGQARFRPYVGKW